MPQSDKEEGEDRAGGGKKGRWRPKRRREIERGKNLLLCRRSLPRSTAALCCSRQSGYHGRLFSRGLSKLRHRPLLLLPPPPFSEVDDISLSSPAPLPLHLRRRRNNDRHPLAAEHPAPFSNSAQSLFCCSAPAVFPSVIRLIFWHFRPSSFPYRRPFSESDLNFFRSGLFSPKSADRFGWRLDRALHTFYSLSASLRPQIITLPLPFCHSSLPLPLVPGRNEGERKESELHNRGKSGFGHRSSYGANLGRQRCG